MDEAMKQPTAREKRKEEKSSERVEKKMYYNLYVT